MEVAYVKVDTQSVSFFTGQLLIEACHLFEGKQYFYNNICLNLNFSLGNTLIVTSHTNLQYKANYVFKYLTISAESQQ